MVSTPRHRKLLLLYFRYKDSPYYLGTFIGITLLVSVLLIIYIVIPQVSSFFSVAEEVATTQEQISTLKNNTAYLTSLNTATLNDQLNLVFEALPADKDFAAVIDAINTAALDSGVSVNDYSVLVGELATPSAELKQFVTLDLSISVAGTKEEAKAFLQKMYEVLPISQVRSLALTEESSMFKIAFYFKPYPKGTYNVTQPIGAIPPQKEALFNVLATWQHDTQPDGPVQENLPPDSAIGSPF
jgi:Tfp pilus assembly protein PilO